MKIYTKTGDKGMTDTINIRKYKDDILLHCIGELDELNAHLGLAYFYGDKTENYDILKCIDEIQQKIYEISAELVDIEGKFMKKIQDEDITHLEKLIDKFDQELEPLASFIYFRGNEFSNNMNISRTICRRVERGMVSLNREYKNLYEKAQKYINRLSDILFTCYRVINKRSDINESRRVYNNKRI